MEDVMTKERIKETRSRYGLSQRSFAKLLGIGEATMVRYEKGSKPTRANANLLRAAEDPRFMQGCLERSGGEIPASQSKQASRYIYEYINFDEPKEPSMDMNEMYDLTLRQEVLTEKAAGIIATIIRWQVEDEESGGEGTLFNSVLGQVSQLKPTIVDNENANVKALDRIDGYLDCARECITREQMRIAS